MKPTRTNLRKLEDIFRDLAYTVRYEKGNFQSGYCVVENRNIVVISKFFDTEGRMATLIEILAGISIDPESLSETSRHMIQTLQKQSLIPLSSTE